MYSNISLIFYQVFIASSASVRQIAGGFHACLSEENFTLIEEICCIIF